MALFDRFAADYDQWYTTHLGAFADVIEKNLIKNIAKPKEGETALDLGCGTGIYTFWLAEQGLSVTGIDRSRKMLEIAKAKKDSANVHFVQGDIHNLPFSDDTFDLIISNIVLEFADDPKHVVAETFRVLKPGGRFVCGFIGKESEWGKMYRSKGKNDTTSVFSSATFFHIKEIRNLAPTRPVDITGGLYVAPQEFTDSNEGKELEEKRQKSQAKDGAGYIVAKWIKP